MDIATGERRIKLLHNSSCRLEFLSISQVIDHVTCYKFECSHWWKNYFFKKILYKICSPV